MNDKNGWVETGSVPVDSGSVLISDPAYVLPDPRDPDRQRADYAMVMANLEAQMLGARGARRPISPLAPNLFGAVLVQFFGGDGEYPIYAKIEDGQVRAVMIDFDGVMDE